MENKGIFKVGDIVYHYKYGKGKVIISDEGENYPVTVDFDGVRILFTRDGRQIMGHPPTLSFTTYDLVNGGLSQDRPLPDIEVDTLVYVRDRGKWEMRFFSHFGEGGAMRCFDWQQKSTETDSLVDWPEWSLTNPLEEK